MSCICMCAVCRVRAGVHVQVRLDARPVQGRRARRQGAQAAHRRRHEDGRLHREGPREDTLGAARGRVRLRVIGGLHHRVSLSMPHACVISRTHTSHTASTPTQHPE